MSSPTALSPDSPESLPSAAPVAPLRLGVPLKAVLVLAALLVAAVLIWQGVSTGGSPDPTQPGTSPAVAVFDIAVLVFREGLECILVLAALTANMVGPLSRNKLPVLGGAGVGFVATLVTWFIAVGIVHELDQSVSALNLQAATGLLAVVVLLVVMNWFFHKVYWGGWISMHHKRKRDLMKEQSAGSEGAARKLILGLGLLGFASLYREGFEVVLFLQTYYLKMGGLIVFQGALLGLVLSGMVAVLTFVAHRKLPYRKMLVLTGILLGVVLLVMVGEQAQEMQQANWIPTTNIDALKGMPDWLGVWFSVFPTVETLAAQAVAAVLVIGSYFVARRGTSASPSEAVAS